MPGLSDVCGVCRQEFHFSLPRCSCRKAVCGSCSVRMGGSVFCGKTCAHAFFYGGDEDVDEIETTEAAEDE